MTKKLVLADFDETLIYCDSMVTILKKEKWYLDLSLLMAGAKLVLAKIFGKKVYERRSAFKYIMMCKYRNMPPQKQQEYIEYFKGQINKAVIDKISEIEADRIVVASASDSGIISQVLDGIVGVSAIVANDWCADAKDFRTCYGEEKARRFCEEVADYKNNDIYVFSDSVSDQPIYDLGIKKYLVDKNTISEL